MRLRLRLQMVPGPGLHRSRVPVQSLANQTYHGSRITEHWGQVSDSAFTNRGKAKFSSTAVW
jgi:hypothetical protein